MIFKVRTEEQLRRAIKLCTEENDCIEIDGAITIKKPVTIPQNVIVRGQ